MGIVILKDEVGIKFYIKEDKEPAVVIYSGSQAGIITDDMVLSGYHADRLSEVMLIMGMFITCLNASEHDAKKKAFTVVFRSDIFDETKNHEQKYNAKQMLSNVFSGSVVTVNKKDRLKYQFVDFNAKDGKLIINCKPVIW